MGDDAPARGERAPRGDDGGRGGWRADAGRGFCFGCAGSGREP